jgi:hypothetical protein
MDKDHSRTARKTARKTLAKTFLTLAKKAKETAFLPRFLLAKQQSIEFRGDGQGFPWYGYMGPKLPLAKWRRTPGATIVALDRGPMATVTMVHTVVPAGSTGPHPVWPVRPCRQCERAIPFGGGVPQIACGCARPSP